MALALLLLTGAPPFGGGARAAPPTTVSVPDLRSDIEVHLGEETGRLLGLLAELERQRIPLALWQQKLREGLAKKVPPARIATALERMGTNLLWAQERLAACERLAADHRSGMLALVNDILWGGPSREQLAPVLAAACEQADPLAATTRTGETYLYLVNRLGASPEAAWAFATELVGQDDSQGAVNRIVILLNDLHRKRGSIDRILERATKRLRAGASLRTVRNELREQFLHQR